MRSFTQLPFIIPAVLLFVESHPSRCDPSLLTEYFDFKHHRYYLLVGHNSFSPSVISGIDQHFDHSQTEQAIRKLKSFLNADEKDWKSIHDAELQKLLEAMHPNSQSANVHPILVGPELNITITAAFDNSSNRLTVIVARNDVGTGISSQLFYIENATSGNFGSGHELLTAVDMGRGLLHIVIEDNAKQILEHEVIQIKMIRGSIHMTRVRTETLNITISHVTADPKGNYLFYKMEDRNRHSMHIFRAVMDHPYFSLHSPNTTSRIVSVRDGDVFSVVDRNAIVLWKLVDGVRTAWLYEGSTKRTGGVVKEFEKIGCVMSSINDDDGQLLFRILQVSKKH